MGELSRDLRVLIVEDECLTLMMEEEILDELGCTIFGSTNHLAEAFGMVRESLPDAAILDFRIGDEKSLELAHYLSERNVPIVLVTGYASEIKFPALAICEKPFSRMNFKGCVVGVLQTLNAAQLDCAPKATA